VLDEQLIRIFGAYAEEGAVTALALARKVNMVPVGLVAQAAGIAAYPTLARLHAEGRTGDLRATAAATLRMAFFVGGLATAAVIATAPEALRVLFERGAWTADSTVRAASALLVFSLSIPFWAAHQLLSRSLYAQRRMWAPVLIGTAATVVALPLYPWAVNASDGGATLAIASTAGIVLTTLGLAGYWFRGHGDEVGPVVGTMLRVVPAVALAGVAGRYAASLVPAAGAGEPFVTSLLAVGAGGLVAAVVFALVSRLVASRELSTLAARLPAPWDERVGGRRP
jgi:putative peptidoglycan lipid II flippase